MAAIKIQIEKLINGSVFLDSDRKNALLKSLEQASEEKQKELLGILQSQEAFLRDGFKKFIQKNGKSGLEVISQLLLKAGGKVNREKEVKDRSDEDIDAEKLLSDIANA